MFKKEVYGKQNVCTKEGNRQKLDQENFKKELHSQMAVNNYRKTGIF